MTDGPDCNYISVWSSHQHCRGKVTIFFALFAPLSKSGSFFGGVWLAAITLMNNCYWLSRIPEYYRSLLGRKYYE